MAGENRLRILGQEEVTEETQPISTAPAKSQTSEGVEAWAAVKMGLGVLSQRALNMVLALLALGTGFSLWQTILPNPTPAALLGVSLYAMFMVAILWVRR